MTLLSLHAAYLAAAIVLITVLLLLGAAAELGWCRSVFTAWDFLGGAILGGDGKHSISAYTGAHAYAGAEYVEIIIDAVFGAGHCAKAARVEGLLA